MKEWVKILIAQPLILLIVGGLEHDYARRIQSSSGKGQADAERSSNCRYSK
jgi:hypothetical protein